MTEPGRAALVASESGRTLSPEEVIARALFAYNTPQAHHFVIHDGGYEGIAQVALDALSDAGYWVTPLVGLTDKSAPARTQQPKASEQGKSDV